MLKIILLNLIGLLALSNALQFRHEPVSLDSDVFIVGRQSTLSCNFVNFGIETVRTITWYVAYGGVRSTIFRNMLITGAMEKFDYGFIKVHSNESDDDGSTAKDEQLTVTLLEYLYPTMTIGCEVDFLRDNGYGEISQNKKLGETDFEVIKTDHRLHMVLKSDKQSVVPGSPIEFTCVVKGTDPAPKLIITAGRQYQVLEVEVIEHLGKGSGVVARVRRTPESWFDGAGVMNVNCFAKFKSYMHDKRQIGVSRNWMDSQVITTEEQLLLFQVVQVVLNTITRMRTSLTQPGMLDHMTILAHSMVTYFWRKGTSKGHSNSGGTTYTVVNGTLPSELQMTFYRMYGETKRIGSTFLDSIVIKLPAVRVLNIVGKFGYRVVSSAFNGDDGKGMLWTLERQKFNYVKEEQF